MPHHYFEEPTFWNYAFKINALISYHKIIQATCKGNAVLLSVEDICACMHGWSTSKNWSNWFAIKISTKKGRRILLLPNDLHVSKRAKRQKAYSGLEYDDKVWLLDSKWLVVILSLIWGLIDVPIYIRNVCVYSLLLVTVVIFVHILVVYLKCKIRFQFKTVKG